MNAKKVIAALFTLGLAFTAHAFDADKVRTETKRTYTEHGTAYVESSAVYRASNRVELLAQKQTYIDGGYTKREPHDPIPSSRGSSTGSDYRVGIRYNF